MNEDKMEQSIADAAVAAVVAGVSLEEFLSKCEDNYDAALEGPPKAL